jgi:hypothetical protein
MSKRTYQVEVYSTYPRELLYYKTFTDKGEQVTFLKTLHASSEYLNGKISIDSWVSYED